MIREIEELDNGPLASKEGVVRFFAERGIGVVRMSDCHLSGRGWKPEPESPIALGRKAPPRTKEDRMGWISFDEMAEESGREKYYIAMLVSMGKVAGSMKSKKGSLSSLEAHLGSKTKK